MPKEIKLLPKSRATLPFHKNLYKTQYKDQYNEFEEDVAFYIDDRESIKWWHRLGTHKTEWHIQGWKKDRIYPDFLVYHDKDRFIFIETKGDHLDVTYKRRVFEVFNTTSTKPEKKFELIDDGGTTCFVLKFQKDWEIDRKIDEIENIKKPSS